MKQKQSKKPMLSAPARLLYGAGIMPYGILQQTLYPLALLFAVDAMSLPGWLTGIALSLGLLTHAVCDPLARRLSDKSKSVLWGKRHGLYIAGVFAAALANILLWSMPINAAPGLKFLWLAVSVIALSMLISFMQMPYNALGDELAGDAAEKKTVHNIKNLFFMVSLAVPLILMGVLLGDTRDPDRYMGLALILSGAAVIVGTLAFFATYPYLPRLRAKAAALPDAGGEKFSLPRTVKNYFSALKVKDGRAVLLGYCTSLMSVAFLSGTGILFLLHTMNIPVYLVALDVGLMFFAAIASQFFWPRAASRYGKKPAVIAGVVITLVGILIACIAFIVCYHLGAVNGLTSNWILIPSFVIAGFGIGAVFCIPSGMLADKIPDDSAEKLSGMMNFFYRTGQAAVILVSGCLISIFGYNKLGGADDGLMRGALGWIVILGASIALGFSVWLFQTYQKPPRAKQLKIKVKKEIGAKNEECGARGVERGVKDESENGEGAAEPVQLIDGQMYLDFERGKDEEEDGSK